MGVELAVRRIFLVHGLIMTLGGLPLLDLGDEIAQLNDDGYRLADWHRSGIRQGAAAREPWRHPGRQPFDVLLQRMLAVAEQDIRPGLLRQTQIEVAAAREQRPPALAALAAERFEESTETRRHRHRRAAVGKPSACAFRAIRWSSESGSGALASSTRSCCSM